MEFILDYRYRQSRKQAVHKIWKNTKRNKSTTSYKFKKEELN